jgi:hypothetical protein
VYVVLISLFSRRRFVDGQAIHSRKKKKPRTQQHPNKTLLSPFCFALFFIIISSSSITMSLLDSHKRQRQERRNVTGKNY